VNQPTVIVPSQQQQPQFVPMVTNPGKQIPVPNALLYIANISSKFH